MSKILVTGSAGMIGHHLVSRLQDLGHEVVGLDLRAPTVEDLGDIRDRYRVERLLRGCHGIVHLAAVSRVLDAARDPGRCRSTNITGTRILLTEARRAECGWFLFTSSREVFGQPDRLPATERTPLRPVNLYGRTKLIGERLVAGVAAQGLPTCVVRLTNTYGSALDYPDRVVPAFLGDALSGRPLRVEGPDHVIDLLHVDDAVEGLVRLVQRLDGHTPPAPTLLLCSGTGIKLADLARRCGEAAGVAATVEIVPPREGHVSAFVGRPRLARRTLGWRSSVPLEAGLTRMANDLRSLRAGQAREGSAS